MSVIDTSTCDSFPEKRHPVIRADRIGGLLLFTGAVVFHLAVIFNLLPSA